MAENKAQSGKAQSAEKNFGAMDVAKNSGAFVAGRWIGKLLALATVLLLAPYLLPELFGQYSLITAFLGFFLFLNDFGVYSFIVRDISRDESNASHVLGTAFALKGVLSLAAISLAVLSAALLAYPWEIVLLVAIYSLTILIGGLGSVFGIVFNTELRVKYNVYTELIERISYLAIALFVMYALPKEQAMFWLISGLVVSVLLSNIARYFFFRRLVSAKPQFKFRPEINLPYWKRLLKQSWPFAFITLCIAIYGRIDIVMLSKMVGESAVGYYSSGYRITDTLILIPTALMVSLFPIMSHYFSKNREKLATTHSLALKYLAMVMLPAAIGTTFLSDKILTFLYGTGFIGSETGMFLSLSLLMWAVLFAFFNYVNSYTLNSMNLEKVGVAVLSCGIVVKVLLNLFFIPAYSYVGSAFATLATEALVFAAFTALVWKHLGWAKLGIFARPLAASAVMLAFILLAPVPELLAVVSIAALVYFVSLYALGAFTQQDKGIIMGVLTGTGIAQRFLKK
ncbi:MAG: flippase [Candidatus Diapherotrites archaeon]